MEATRRAFLIGTGAAAGAVILPGADRASAQSDSGLGAWRARWITVAGIDPTGFGIYHFRRTFELGAKPERFFVRVSGDNRYQLYVNGRRVAWGPARGDLMHWRFETVDIAPQLRAGSNVLAAVVWNFGPHAPKAQITLQTGFILQGDDEVVDTGSQWRCTANRAYSPFLFSHGDMRGYFVAGPGELVDGAQYPWGWEGTDFDDSAWKKAAIAAPGAGHDARDVHSRWMLVPRNIPMMEERPERITKIRRSDGPELPAGFPADAVSFTLAANTKATYLLDQTYLTTGYPELAVSGGKGARITLRYAECLQIGKGKAKGNRDEIEGKDFIGYHDTFIADGGAGRVFRPLWWRTWRYIEMEVETAGEPLTIEDLRSTYTAYPFERKATFETSDPSLAKIIDVGWRTARLCAHETYMDCPYYEQLQYVGDTRIQALISLYNTGDARLMRNAIEQIDQSRVAGHPTMSRYPTRLQQYIPSFSLIWIGMVHDYWRYVDDPDFVRRMLPGVRAVIAWYEQHVKPNGSLGVLPWWRFMDWADEWKNGDAPSEADGSAATYDLLLAMAYGWAADLEAAYGYRAMAPVYRESAARVRTAAQTLYWDASRRLYADTPAKKAFSHHANILAVLAGLASGPAAADLLVRTASDTSLVQTSIYFRHYLFTALQQTGEGDRYLPMLADWHTMIDKYGLTTFSEVLDAPGRRSRSDCHAWSASPLYELMHTVLGIDSAAPHFRKVVIRPYLGALTSASGSIPHPAGTLSVALERRNAALVADVIMPPGITGEFVWKEARRPLPSGRTQLKLQA